jgi:SAM-dependent methyltransferase
VPTTLPIQPVRVEPWHAAPPSEFLADDAPTIPTDDVPACPVCACERFSLHAVGFDYELRTCRNPWRFVRCEGCSHVWLNPRPAIGTLAAIYPPHYYAYHYTEKVSPLALRIKNRLDSGKFAGLLKALGRAPGAFVDIGCGDGRYLRFAERAGVPKSRDYGLELDAKVVEKLNAQGYVGLCERVEDCRTIPRASIDLATMFHVIEHVDDPRAVVRTVADWLAPGGIFAVETPNIDSLDARLFGGTYWGGYHIPRHWNMFSPPTLSRLLTDAGLEVVGTRYQTGHSFWMYSLHHATRYKGTLTRDERVRERISPKTLRARASRVFDPFGGLPSLPALAACTAFDKARIMLGRRTSSMLMLARKPA